MRRLSLIALLLMVTFFYPTTYAQETSPTVVPTPDEAVVRAEDAAARAETAANNARDYSNEAVNLASALFTHFETITGVVGILLGVLPVLAVAAGFLGLNRLTSAQRELEETRKRVELELVQARERFAKELEDKERDLNALRDELTRSAQQQREDAAKASLAQSLMPLGERQYRSQDYIGALDTYKRALELDPDNLIIHYRMGYVYTQSGELELADKHLSSALQIEPGFAPALAALGYVYRRMGEKMPQGVDRDLMLNKAEEHMLEALKLQPKLVDDDGESWWGSLGGLYRRRGQVDQAIYAYERATEVTPHSSYGFGNLATLYGQKNEIAKMKNMYKRVEQLASSEVQADVDNYWAYADLIVSRLALGKVKEAEEILDTVLETAPADSPYTLESLIDTMSRLATLLKDEDTSALQRSITYTRQFLDRRRQQQEAEAQKRKTGEIQAVTES
jgi:tetratricopeptide (TPR) repeat protein